MAQSTTITVYEAIGEVANKLYPTKLKASGLTFNDVKERIEDITKEISYYTRGHNGNPFSGEVLDEPWLENLIFPEVKWEIKRVERTIKTSKGKAIKADK